MRALLTGACGERAAIPACAGANVVIKDATTGTRRKITLLSSMVPFNRQGRRDFRRTATQDAPPNLLSRAL
jgi:hypothetical protein